MRAPELRAICTAADTPAAAASIARRKSFPASLLRGARSFFGQLFFQQLLLIQLGVISAAPDQFLVRPSLDDFSVAQHYDLVRFADCRASVRNQNRGALAHHVFEPLQDLFL